MNETTSRRCYPTTSGWVAAGLIIVSALMLKHLELGSVLRVATSLLPVPALIWMVTVQVRWIRGLDELQQRIQLLAMAIAFGGTGLAVMTYGFLQIAGLPAANWAFVWPVMAALYYVGGMIARKRYQ